VRSCEVWEAQIGTRSRQERRSASSEEKKIILQFLIFLAATIVRMRIPLYCKLRTRKYSLRAEKKQIDFILLLCCKPQYINKLFLNLGK
jgi:hypothetical protein